MAATAAKTADQIKAEFNEKLNKELKLNDLKNKFLELGLNVRYVSTFEGAKNKPILNIELNADRFSRDYEEPTKEELKQAIQTILEAFPATEQRNNLKFAGKEEQEHKSPFKLTIENPARERQEAKISYASTECEIWITYNPFTMFNQEGQLQKLGLRRLQVRRHRPHPEPGSGAGRVQRARQRRLPWQSPRLAPVGRLAVPPVLGKVGHQRTGGAAAIRGPGPHETRLQLR